MATNKTVKVTAKGLEGFLVETKAGTHTALVDQPPAMGGKDQGPTPLDYVFISLAGCLVTIAKIVANQKKIVLRDVEVEVEGELNLEVLRGQDTTDRAGFKSFKVGMKVDADMTKEEKEKFIEEVDRRCPISDNLMNTTPIEIALID
ncbi:MAG TPA: osmotically inducible protein C [Anaerolineaceae bacterium]|nr:osmotically inducible protein C [Anaerolineaceae bacterium]